jgi:hypothetical protein
MNQECNPRSITSESSKRPNDLARAARSNAWLSNKEEWSAVIGDRTPLPLAA